MSSDISLSQESAVKMYLSPLLIILFASTVAVISGQQDNCDSQETCAACIRSRDCVWCDAPVGEDSAPPLRCVTRRYAANNGRNNWCNRGNIVNETTRAKITDAPLSGAKDGVPVQIRPRTVELKLRLGEEYRFKVQYRQAEDYPVDLYFVADLSYSMRPFWKEFVHAGKQIVEAMHKLTSNFRLGFGSFVDKNIRPMTSDKKKWDHLYHYAFKNHLPLSNDIEVFENAVKDAKSNGNSDNPEGGFDGVMQAMVCKKEIGWRSDARHIIVYASDDPPHIAGDGRLAGLPEPNDMLCHLNKSGYYSQAELQDYPSLGQIKWQVDENNINIIFAVLVSFKKMYDAVQTMIPGSSIGILDKSSDNIAQLISKHYEKLVRSLTMTSKPWLNFLDIKYYSRCLEKRKDLTQRNKCDGIHVNDTIEFEIAIKAVDCPKREEDWHQTIVIKPEGINEGVEVKVELICGCECSKKSAKEANRTRDAKCSNHGILDCGICSCDRGYAGESCQCNSDADQAGTNEPDKTCYSEKSSEICSGRGTCVCGTCSCGNRPNSEEKYHGKFCQCDDFSCGYSTDGKLCGGPGRGRCDCGECKCERGWSGPVCECREDTSLCLPPGENSKICSNFGKCECGRCICDKNERRDGKFCEDCPTCPSQRCDDFKDCVECRVHKTGAAYAADGNCLNCSKLEIVPVDEVDEDQDNVKPEDHICRIAGNDGSTFVFKYAYSDDNDNRIPKIFATNNKEFPVISSSVATTLGVILLTLLVGFLVLLIWKIATHLHDKREYEKFVKDRSEAKWGQGDNPLYKGVVTTFPNPTFNSAEIAEDDDL